MTNAAVGRVIPDNSIVERTIFRFMVDYGGVVCCLVSIELWSFVVDSVCMQD